ncbi:MAG: hypothetical protein JWM95_3605 [Gemmatimonadetes bacterium]|nr:hypothetical protein [Gemmatimonadota bacterium]
MDVVLSSPASAAASKRGAAGRIGSTATRRSSHIPARQQLRCLGVRARQRRVFCCTQRCESVSSASASYIATARSVTAVPQLQKSKIDTALHCGHVTPNGGLPHEPQNVAESSTRSWQNAHWPVSSQAPHCSQMSAPSPTAAPHAMNAEPCDSPCNSATSGAGARCRASQSF